jgi:hypothetical protein
MIDEPVFQTVEAGKLQADLVRILCRTAREKGRIEITNCDGGSCVMISKEELDYLEAALEILSKTDGVQEMHRRVRRYAAMSLEGAGQASFEGIRQ